MTSYIKDPDAVLDYTLDWSSWLVDGDTILYHDVEVPDGITLDDSDNTDTVVTAWLSGGEVDTNYPVRFQVTTADGRTDDRTVMIYVRQR